MLTYDLQMLVFVACQRNDFQQAILDTKLQYRAYILNAAMLDHPFSFRQRSYLTNSEVQQA
jgi:hypothetical protein